MRRTALVVLALLAVTGCTADADDRQEPPGAAAAGGDLRHDPVPPENGTAPAAFLQRDRLPSCGSYAWTLDDEGPPADTFTCLADAATAGDEAEVVLERPTVDSGPLVSYYRVRDDSAAVEAWFHEVWSGRWVRAQCTSVDRDDGPQPCEAVEEFGDS